MLGTTSILSGALLPCLLLPTSTDDAPAWGGFRGPNGTGSATSPALPDTLDPEKTLRWRTEVPGGYSSPIVTGDRVFLTAATGKKLLTLCLDRHTGEEIWQRELPFSGKRPGANSPAAPTPVTDGKAVYCLFNDFGVVAYDMEGEDLWEEPLGPFTIPHGMSSSPVLAGDLLLLQIDQDSGSWLSAYDKKTGKARWTVDRPGFTHSYATPAVCTPEDGPAQVIVSGSYKVCSYALADGELLWWVDGSAFMTKGVPLVVGSQCYLCAYAMPSTEAGLPNITQTFAEALAERDADGNGKISLAEFDHPGLKMAWSIFDLDDDGFFDEADWAYLASSCKPTGGLFAIDCRGRGDVSASHVLWKYDGRRGLPDCTSPVVVGDTIFLVKGGSLLSTFDTKSGELARMERICASDNYFASPVTGDGKVYTASLSGQLTVLSALREWEVLSATNLNEEVWSTPALVDGQVLVRSQKALYCFMVPEGE